MKSRRKAKVYPMNPNFPRILEAVLLVLTEAKERSWPLTQYDIVKTMFLADRAHLNKYGRPITFDNYVAMKFGPVPSLVYDLLKENRQLLKKYDVAEVPWSRRKAPEVGETCFVFEHPTRVPDEDLLSPSDVEELTAAMTIVRSLGFHQIKKLTHEDAAYVDAWDDESDYKQFPMSYALMFETPNDELAKDLAFLSENI